MKIAKIPWVSVGGVDREGHVPREQKILVDKIIGSLD